MGKQQGSSTRTGKDTKLVVAILVSLNFLKQTGAVPPATALELLPVEVLDWLQNASFDYGWLANNIYSRARLHAADDKRRGNQAIERVRSYAQGLLSPNTVDLLHEAAQLQGWYAAQGYRDSDEQYLTGPRVDEVFAELKSTEELSSNLLDGIHTMLEKASWYTAVASDQGESQEAKKNKALSNSAKSSIVGTVWLEDIQIHTSTAKIIWSKPILVSEEIYINEGSVAQSETFSFSRSEGSTSSWSQSFGSKIRIKTSVTAKAIFVRVGTRFSFEADFEKTWVGGTSEGRTLTYTFSLVTPPASTYKLTAIVHEIAVNADYSMTLSIGGHRLVRNGSWYGLADSEMTTKTSPVRQLEKIEVLASHPQAWAVALAAFAGSSVAAFLVVIIVKRRKDDTPYVMLDGANS